jgi:hypothetical protein
MLNSRARNATAAARPVKISGVARVSVSVSANRDPKPPCKSARIGLAHGRAAQATSRTDRQREGHGQQRSAQQQARDGAMRSQAAAWLVPAAAPGCAPVIARPMSASVQSAVARASLSRPWCITEMRSASAKTSSRSSLISSTALPAAAASSNCWCT